MTLAGISTTAIALALSFAAQAAPPARLDPARQQEAQRLLKLALAIPTADHDPLDYSGGAIAEAQARLGDFTSAYATVAQLTSDISTSQTTSMVVRLQFQQGDGDGARKKATELGATFSKADDLRKLASLQIELGDISEAEATLKKIDDLSARSQILSELAAAQFKAHDLTSAKRNFDEAINAVSQDKQADARAWSVADIAVAQTECGDDAGAQRTLTKVAGADADDAKVEVAIVRNNRVHDNSASKLLTARTKTWIAFEPKNLDEAIDDCHHLMRLAEDWIAIGQPRNVSEPLDRATDIASRLGDSEWNPELHADIAVVYARGGNAEQSKRLIGQAITEAQNLPHERGADCHGLWFVAASQTWTPLADQTQKTVALAIERGPIDPIEVGFIAVRVARQMATALGPTADLSWIGKLTDPGDQRIAYAAAAAGMLTESRKE